MNWITNSVLPKIKALVQPHDVTLANALLRSGAIDRLSDEPDETGVSATDWLAYELDTVLGVRTGADARQLSARIGGLAPEDPAPQERVETPYVQFLRDEASGLDVLLGGAVLSIDHSGDLVSLRLETGESFAADRAIVTVPLGVLRANLISFTPALPLRHARAVSVLGNGLLDQVWLRFDESFLPAGPPVRTVVAADDDPFAGWLDLGGSAGERVLVGVEGIGIGQNALARAVQYAKDRVVFDRPIGMNQSIAHPLAEIWCELEAAWLMAMDAAGRYDKGLECGAQCNAAKYLGGEAGFKACQQAIMTHGGMGYAKEFHVERLLRESLICRIAPVSPQMILNFISERVLGLPRSY